MRALGACIAVLLLAGTGCPNPPTQPFFDCQEGCWSQTWREEEPGGILETEPSRSFDFGPMDPEQSYEATVTLRNAGNRQLEIWGVELWSNFLCSVECPESSLNVGEETTWTVRAACMNNESTWTLDAWFNLSNNSENFSFSGDCSP